MFLVRAVTLSEPLWTLQTLQFQYDYYPIPLEFTQINKPVISSFLKSKPSMLSFEMNNPKVVGMRLLQDLCSAL
jgi:hypothetical protein